MADDEIQGQLSLFSPEQFLEEPEEAVAPEPSPADGPPAASGSQAGPAAADPGTGSGSARRRYVVFDLETKNTFEDVGGRANMHKLEVSVGVAYNSGTDTYTVYREDELGKMVEELRSAEVVVGYNIVGFDYPVLQRYTEFDLYQLPTIDLMLGIEHTLGYRIGLDKVAAATLGTGKSGHGLQAIEWFKNGQWELLIKYCKQDVKVTRDLYEFGLDNGFVYVPAAGDRKPVEVRFVV